MVFELYNTYDLRSFNKNIGKYHEIQICFYIAIINLLFAFS